MRPLLVTALALAPALTIGFRGHQMANVWSPEPGWQLIGDHPGSPDAIVVGIFGEAYQPREPSGATPIRPSRAEMTRRLRTANAPRLTLTCEEGATSLKLIRPTQPPPRSGYRNPSDQRMQQSAGFDDASGTVVLRIDEGDPVDIDLREYPRRTDPVYLPEPFDTIQALQRGETLYYWEIRAGQYVAFDWDAATQPPDAVFPLEGLREFLAATRDPCGWASD